jgi:DNA-binding CsgD family transcriptional regulator
MDTAHPLEREVTALTKRIEMLEAHFIMMAKSFESLPPKHSPSVDHALESIPPPSPCPTNDLVRFTAKQHATMQMLALGKSNRYIADMLKVSESTAKVHVRSVMQKKKATNRQEVMAEYKITLSLCSPEEYLTYSGIPKDWAIHPENYPTHTTKLRESYHVKTGETS